MLYFQLVTEEELLYILGSENFVMKLEGILDRILRYGKAGRPKKETGKQKKWGN